MKKNIIRYRFLEILVILTLSTVFFICGCTKKEPDKQVIRQLTYPENLPDQMELDAQHRAVHDANKWGQGEIKPWNERYRIDDSKTPYQGGVGNSKNN